MYRESRLKCPYLEGHSEGVKCRVRDEFIRNMEDINMKLCAGKHYEVCHIYFLKLQGFVSDVSLNAA